MLTSIDSYAGKCNSRGHENCHNCWCNDVAMIAVGECDGRRENEFPGPVEQVKRTYKTSSGKEVDVTRENTRIHLHGMCPDNPDRQFPDGKCEVCVDVEEGYFRTVIGGACCKCYLESDVNNGPIARPLGAIGEMRELEKWTGSCGMCKHMFCSRCTIVDHVIAASHPGALEEHKRWKDTLKNEK